MVRAPEEHRDDVDDEVGMVGIEPLAHLREFGQEEEVEEIDVERTYADILESSPNAFLLGEEGLVVTEEHDDDEHEGVHG